MGLLIWWWMSNESLQLFYILDSFFYLTAQVWISWLFDPTSQNKFFCCCFFCCCSAGLVYLATTTNHHMGNFLQVCCSFYTLGWSLKPNYCWDIWFPEIMKKGFYYYFFIPTWFNFHWHFHPPKKKLNNNNNNYVSGYFFFTF